MLLGSQIHFALRFSGVKSLTMSADCEAAVLFAIWTASRRIEDFPLIAKPPSLLVKLPPMTCIAESAMLIGVIPRPSIWLLRRVYTAGGHERYSNQTLQQ